MTFTHPENVIINQPQQTPPFTGNLLDVKLAGTSKAYIDQDGKVAIGMGSNAPVKIVSIGSPGPNGVAVHSLSNSWMGLQVHRGPLASDEKWFIGLGDTATYGNKLLLRRTASTDDIVIDENGNVGIGTASPGAKLEVVGNIKTNGNMAAIEGLSGRNLAINGGFKSAPHPVEQSGASILGSEVGSGAGLIQSNSNLQLLRNLVVAGQPGDPDNPPYIYLGLDQDNLLYAFFQYRTDANGGIWGGVETFKRPPIGIGAAWGYGFQPIRIWGKNTKLDEAGQVVARRSIAPVISLLRPKHVDPTTATFQYPDSYNTQNRPFKGTTELGGIGYDPADETVQIYRSGTNNDGPDLILKDVNNSGGVRLSEFARGVVDKVKVDNGESALNGIEVTDANQTPPEYSIPANSTADLGWINLHTTFSSPFQYIVLLTPRNRLNSWGVSLVIQDRINNSFHVLGRNDHPTLDAEFYIQWVAIGT